MDDPIKPSLLRLCFVLCLFLAAGCAQPPRDFHQGTVREKKFTPAHTDLQPTVGVDSDGDVAVSWDWVDVPDCWHLRIEAEFDGKMLERWIVVTHRTHDRAKIGEWLGPIPTAEKTELTER